MHRIVFVLFIFLFSFCGNDEIQNNDVSLTSPSSTTTSIAETTSTTIPKETVTTVKNIKLNYYI